MNCPSCGGDLKEGARFCTGCGAQIPAQAPAGPPAPQAGGVPAPPPRQAAPAGVPAPPPKPAPSTSPEEDVPAFEPQQARDARPAWLGLGSSIALAALAALAVFLLARHIWMGGSQLQRVSGAYDIQGNAFYLEMPDKGWYVSRKEPATLDELAVFYRGRGPGAPVTLRIVTRKIPTPMTSTFTDEAAAMLKEHFVQRADRLLVRDGLGFEPGEPQVAPGGGFRNGVRLSGKAAHPGEEPFPVHLFFYYSGHDEFTLVFTVKAKDPDKYEKEIAGIAKTFIAK